ncbi:MAG: heme-binding domain-containing protein [Candidatus Zixiibacteriota bacterium]|nr:MAG: heme-binding domain-containing protein [candidate division Zixibacteria bacterium]
MVFKRIALPAAVLTTLIVAAFDANYSGNPYEELQRAYAGGELSLQQLVEKQDSVFALINLMYRPVRPILRHSCFDCHSDSTEYPWYHKLPLIKGMIDDHISEAREHLDLTHDFPFSGKGSSLELLEEIKHEIEEEKMPLLSYRLLHWGTLIEGGQRDSLFAWIDSTAAILDDFFGEPDDNSTETADTD